MGRHTALTVFAGLAAIAGMVALLGAVRARADAAPDPVPVSPWVGAWILHEPYHGSYVANELRFYADGQLARTAGIDTHPRHGQPLRALGVVLFGRKSCRLGERWRPHRSVYRVIVAGVCSDGRDRDLTLALPRGSFDRPVPQGTLRALRAGDRRARLGASFEQVLERCSPDPDAGCSRFISDPRTVRLDEPGAP